MREAPLYQAMLLTSDRNVKANAGRAGKHKSRRRTGKTSRTSGRCSEIELRASEPKGPRVEVWKT